MTTTPTRTTALRLLSALTLLLALAPTAAAAGAKGSMSFSINLVGPGWEQLAAKSAGRPVPEPTPEQSAMARAVEENQGSLQRVYGPDEVRRILDQVRESAVVVGDGITMLTAGGCSGWLETADGTAYSI